MVISDKLDGEWQFRYHTPMYCGQIPDTTSIKIMRGMSKDIEKMEKIESQDSNLQSFQMFAKDTTNEGGRFRFKNVSFFDDKHFMEANSKQQKRSYQILNNDKMIIGT